MTRVVDRAVVTVRAVALSALWHCLGVGESRSQLSAQKTVAAELGSRSDAELISMIEGADDSRISIGGAIQSIRVANTTVFVKLVPVTDRELLAGPECTANLFDLPTYYQYGVGPGSTGFNAWREVAAHQIVSGWVLDGACANFPLLYHWRVLPGLSPRPTATSSAEVDDAVQFWGNSPAVRVRLRALDGSDTVVALFLEYVPYALRDWLGEQLTGGSVRAEKAVALVDRQLLGALRHTRSSGMSHFDSHFGNVLTDGDRVYLTDFGLASAQRFQLDSSELSFFRLTADHDLAYCAAAFVNTIVATSLRLTDPKERNDFVRGCADTGRAPALDGVLADTVVRYAPVATILNDFYWKLHDGRLTSTYPAHLIATALQDAGISEQD